MRLFRVDKIEIRVYMAKSEMGRAAANEAAAILRDIIAMRGHARIIVGTGNSQEDMISALVRTPGLDWSCIEVFHMDEYVGLPETHPASFRRWLRTRLVEVVHPGEAHFLNGDAADWAEECRRYGNLLRAAPIDLCFLGFGENGHIAFNDPHVADFNDPQTLKRVDLDERCRLQQVGEGHFASLAAVPREAVTLTCPALLGAEYLICCVPEMRKAEAVRNALEGPISPVCPASLVRTHPRASVFLDVDSASLLSTK